MKSGSIAYVMSLLTAVMGVACSAAPESNDVGASEDAIQGGSSETGDPAVGLTRTASGYCSATLIAPDVVLTAGHCVASRIIAFYTTDGSTSPTVAHLVNAQAKHPSYVPSQCPSPTLDIGLVHLAAPITNIAPKSFGTAPVVGATCRAVGFGRHVEDGRTERGKKRSATETVASVGQNNFAVSAGTGLADHGDSGGPLLCSDVVVGTVSCHNDGSGPSHTHEYYARVSEAATWIASQMQQWGSSPTGDGNPPQP